MHKRRVTVLFCAILAAFLAVEVQLFYLQIVRGGYYRDYADRQSVALLPENVARARVLTSDGHVLAEDRLAFDVAVVMGRLDPATERRIRQPLRRLFYVHRTQKLLRVTETRCELERRQNGTLVARASSRLEVEVKDNDGRPMVRLVDRELEFPLPEHLVRSAGWLSRMTGDSREELLGRVLDTAVDVARLRTPVFSSVPIIKNVSYDVVAAIETQPDAFRGFEVSTRFERVAAGGSPAGSLAPHLIGYVSRFNPADVRAAVREHRGWPGRAYFMDLRMGRSGVEQRFDDVLRGEFGARCVERDYMNRRQRTLADAPPTPGRDVVLTIDSRLQRIVEQAMASGGPDGGLAVGAAVVMDVRTGHILAIASSPRYDPACFRNADEYRRLTADPNAPLFDRAISGRLPLGSVFKIVTALAALENHCVPASVDCLGFVRLGRRVFRCHLTQGHGLLGLSDGIRRSCNVFFYRTAQNVGDLALIAMARRLGFARRTGLGAPHEAPGNVPLRAPGGELLNLSIGQGRLLVTPVQVARMMAVVANGGVLVPPRVIRELRPFDAPGPAGQPPADERRPVPLGLSREALAAVRLGMYRVVNEPGGTGFRAFRNFNRPFAVSGKTGTAERRVRRNGTVVSDNVGWFAGYAPHRAPRIAFAVAVERLTGSQGGGSAAAPIARRILEAAPLELLGIQQPTPGGGQ